MLSIIIPVRNEARHIAEVLDAIFAQDCGTEKFQVIVVDGQSEDATREIVQRYVEEHTNVFLLDNPKRLSSAARNVGVRFALQRDASLDGACVIVDGHCLIENRSMLSNIERTLASTDADSLGRPQPLEMKGATRLQVAIAAARRSPLGHHPDSFIYANEGRFVPASSVAVVYRNTVFGQVGFFDEDFDACEDVEFNTRLDAAGLRCWFEPSIAIHYVPRGSFAGLAKQLFRYARGRVRLARKHPATFSLKSFAPGLFVIFVAFYILLVATVIGAAHVFGTVPLWLLTCSLLCHAAICVYGFAIFAASLQLCFQQRRITLFPNILGAFLVIHFAFGCGIVYEALIPNFLFVRGCTQIF
ncbi:MAG: glycosyltransferase family 2 protein [Thermoguttaceae bacterium]